MGAFRVEIEKAHRRHDLLLCLLVPGIIILWVGGVSPAAPDELANAYSALFYSYPVIEAILLPVTMALFASRLWDMEVKGGTTKLLYTLQSRRSLFMGKVLFGLLEILLVTAVEIGLIPLLGRLHGYTEALSLTQLGYLTLCTLAVDAILWRVSDHALVRQPHPGALRGHRRGAAGAVLGLYAALRQLSGAVGVLHPAGGLRGRILGPGHPYRHLRHPAL